MHRVKSTSSLIWGLSEPDHQLVLFYLQELGPSIKLGPYFLASHCRGAVAFDGP